MTSQELQSLKNKYDIIGNDPALNRALEIAIAVAPTDMTVLVTGESGVGKENIPKIIHQNSPRKRGKYFAINCGAIPEGTIDSELFGHEKGSFTSAIKMKKGDFELANNGTLFLDEIGDMSLSAQAKVLRALQENKITRVGGESEINVNVRIIAATNKNLKDEIQKGNFREDLYHRLSVIIIHVPPLAERRDDIPLLVNHFIQLICGENGMPVRPISDDAVQLLAEQPWTGNIRELRNVVERLLILSGSRITASDVKAYVL